MLNRLDRVVRFYQVPIGKKAIMAVTGVILFGYVVGHLLGNLQVFLGPRKLNDYARFLHANPTLLWGTRGLLLVSATLHIWSSLELALLRRAARPIGYVKYGNVQASYSSRTMMWSGPIIAAFVVYHLLHFTFGTVHPSFQSLDVYNNVVTGFRSVPVSVAYISAMLLLGMHLQHGLWSMFQSLGANHPRYTPLLRGAAALSAWVVVAGNISIPIAVLTGWVEL